MRVAGGESINPTLTDNRAGRINRRRSATGRQPIIGSGMNLELGAKRHCKTNGRRSHRDNSGQTVRQRILAQLRHQTVMGDALRIIVQQLMEMRTDREHAQAEPQAEHQADDESPTNIARRLRWKPNVQAHPIKQ